MADTPLESPASTPGHHNIWMRGLLMILMAFAFHLAATLLGLIALVQFVVTLVNNAPNARLCQFGVGVGRYLRQIANFVSFAAEEAPFPFSDWPAGD
jgi:Domain of unknown function (DUF4389)